MKLHGLRSIALRGGATTLGVVLRAYAATMRFERMGMEKLRPALTEKSVIYAFSHSQLLLMPFSLPLSRPFRPVHMLISASDDGRLISDAVEQLNIVPVRGSSSRNGDEARRILLQELNDGHHIGITPDGPRGPAKVLKPGITWLARESGATVVPLALNFQYGVRVNSWDRFQIPLPGSKVRFFAGQPISVSLGDFDVAHDQLSIALCSFWRSIDPNDPTFEAACVS